MFVGMSEKKITDLNDVNTFLEGTAGYILTWLLVGSVVVGLVFSILR